jgi:hypothetical protein
MTHEELPWVNAKASGARVITDEDMMAFFKNYLCA